ncbi:DUF1214 domain-containing protein [Chitinophagales bacterium]|nr:DUF1214 domain-containing protein [Chitinophagales bacterium]
MKGILSFILNLIKKWKLLTLKMKGITLDDEIGTQLITGQTWDQYCDTLKAAGGSILYGNPPQNARTQAEAYRYLARLTRAGLEAFTEYNDPEFPVLKRLVHETVKLGADNPDNYYQNAQINGNYEYRITGQRNDVFYIGFFTQNGSYGSTGGLSPCGSLEGDDLVLNEDGTFEIIVSKNPRGQNWLKLEDETTMLMVRQTFMNREKENIAALEVGTINGPIAPKSLSPQAIYEGLDLAGTFVSGASLLFAKWSNDFEKHANQLPQMSPEKSNAAGGDKNIAYYHSYWKIAADEVLKIEVKPPACRYWNFQLNNHWMESLDYRYHPIHINAQSAILEDDGRVVVHVSRENKGYKNWISTTGHVQGTMLWRWWFANEFPEPHCTLFKLNELDDVSE